ncbi:MAG: 2-C-methyl-D-erythritol 2,4-cyclodiphosphate synthase [Gammaproteobacteria bacterium]|nr:2-C-methyl-D-erythritol 2,4-cyclodiphosphate synthase [Gammaproteobacteria bacterium]
MRIGHGYDVHQLVAERKLILGGVEIPHRLGLLGHSDADVLIHAVCDSILGALGLGDIGKHFPDTDANFDNVDSRVLLREVVAKMKGFQLGNLDVTVIAQKPKLAPYLGSMRKNLSQDLKCDVEQINVKATTTEKLGFAGREEGIEAHAVVLLLEEKES